MTLLVAGPQWDKYIAEKAMGWTLSENGWFYGVASHMQGPGKMIRRVHDWYPTTNIAHALEVAEHLAALPGQWFAYHIDHDSMHEDGAYAAQFSNPNGFAGLGGEPITGRAETPAIAICRAAAAYVAACHTS